MLGEYNHVGSSPRPWGTQATAIDDKLALRFIPTPVGNTGAAHPGRHPTAVHPHARGEHCVPAWPVVSGCGSSPRPWGTLAQPLGRTWQRRFIPTPVGNTSIPFLGSVARAVHPHARGEHKRANNRQSSPDGSSPRPWGTRGDYTAHGVFGRFIPTPVGNTSLRSFARTQFSVHPHARGEHGWVREPNVLLHGSSPRPWGTPAVRALMSEHSRFIPTPVGNTTCNWR